MEPVSVGVILYDAENTICRKFTDNWAEAWRRAGYQPLPGLRSAAEEGPIKAGYDYLARTARDQFPDRLLVTQPSRLMPFDAPRDALEWTFAAHVGVPPLGSGGSGPAAGHADGLLGDRIAAMGLAAALYRRSYRFDLRPPSIAFPRVFLRDGVPRNALFAVSVRSESAASSISRRLCEMLSIRKWIGGGVEFGMCTVETRADAERDALEPAVRDAMDLFGRWDADVVHWDGVQGELERIRRDVSPQLAAWPRRPWP